MSKAYQVQFSLPVDNPESNVFKTVKKSVVHFDVPVNYPNMHNVGYAELLRVARETAILDLSTRLNKKKIDSPSKITHKLREQVDE